MKNQNSKKIAKVNQLVTGGNRFQIQVLECRVRKHDFSELKEQKGGGIQVATENYLKNLLWKMERR